MTGLTTYARASSDSPRGPFDLSPKPLAASLAPPHCCSGPLADLTGVLPLQSPTGRGIGTNARLWPLLVSRAVMLGPIRPPRQASYADGVGRVGKYERHLILTGTSEGRQRARHRGVKFGRKPKLTAHQQQEALARRQWAKLLWILRGVTQ